MAKCALDFFPVTSSSGDKIYLKNGDTLPKNGCTLGNEITPEKYYKVSSFKRFSLFLVESESNIPKNTTENTEN